jgi:ABC-type transport system involved in cytochrome bd biosynthesis fused ATPase/permease subunit
MASPVGASPVRRVRPAASGRTPRPSAADVWRLVAVARPLLAGAVCVGLGQAVLLVAQADILARLLADALYRGLTGPEAAGDCLRIVVLALGQGSLGWAWEACAEAAARRVRAATRRRALAASLRLAWPGLSGACPSGHDPAPGAGGMTTLLASGVDDLDPFVARVLPRVVLALAVPVLLLAWIAHLALIAAGLAALALVVGSGMAGLVGADTAAAVRRRLAALQRLADRFDALVVGLPLLRAFGRARDHERAVAASGEDVRAATLATLRVALLAGVVLELLAAVGTALVAVPLGLSLDAGHRILPQALAALILTPEVFLPLRRLTADFHAGASGRAVLARLGRLPADDRPAATEPPPQGTGPVGVLLEAVCLSAAGRSGPLLDRVDLRVLPGERVCLIGESGAGKSSLLRVAAGLVAPSAGRCRHDDVRDPYSAVGPRPALGWVPQHPAVLPATVLDNVALGRAGIDDRVALAALESAGLGTLLGSLPRGLDTPLSELDAPLSLGERRRLAVARSLAGPCPRLWLLDEPTAGLDAATARRLLTELSRVTEGATVIIATHDWSARALGQRVIELHHGRIRGAAGQPRGQASRAAPETALAPRLSAR